MIARVFPRRTAMTPLDEYSFIGEPPLFLPENISEVHVSCLFSWDIPEAERLGRAWSRIAPVKFGGPAIGKSDGDFVPGMYTKIGCVVTSRGCPNNCWFCKVPIIEGKIRELPVTDGWNVLDSNLLACSDEHIKAVFAMLKRQPRKPEFTGGLEAKRLTPKIAGWLRELKPKQIFFAYDTPDDLEPLRRAGEVMQNAGFTVESHSLRCYVLCGFKDDTENKANSRLVQAMKAGFTPMAMLYRNEEGETDYSWRRFQRKWARPAIIHAKEEVGE